MKSATTFFVFATYLSPRTQEGPKLGKTTTESSVEVHIDAPIGRVWKEFGDIGAYFLKPQIVDASHTSADINTGVGARRYMSLSPLIKKELRWTSVYRFGKKAPIKK
jgi:hypothetical protein